MQVAIFSDVHGNLTALNAVLADIEKKHPDCTVFAGDLCVFGARPVDTLALMRANLHILTLYGNTDEMVLNPPVLSDNLGVKKRQHLQFKRDSALWTRNQLSKDDLKWLQAMPFAHRISPTPNAQDDLLIVHANPKDVLQYIFPTPDAQKMKLGDTPFEQSSKNLAALLENVDAEIVAFGHIHFAFVRKWQHLTLANISSVSNPMDRDTVAKYGLLTWNAADSWQIEINRAAYDIQQEQAELAKQQPPKWETLSRVLDGELFLG